MTEEREPRRISRRTIAKGTAWALPAVPLVLATPAYATSGPPPTLTIGDMCKLPGNACGNVFVKGYITEVTVSNTTPLAIYFYNEPGFELTITEDNPDIDLFFQAAVIADGPNAGDVVPFPFQLLPGQSANLIINAGENGNSTNQELTVTITMPWGHNEDPLDDDETVNGEHVPISTTKYFADTPPEQNPSCDVDVPC